MTAYTSAGLAWARAMTGHAAHPTMPARVGAEPVPPLCAARNGCIGDRTHARVWSGVIGVDVCCSTSHADDARRWVHAITGRKPATEPYRTAEET